MRILVVGAGIGGLTAALALGRAGFEVHVYEQSSVLREVGAGIAVSPNAVRVLHRLGLADALRAAGVRSLSLDSRDWQTGALLGRVPLGDAGVARWGAPFYHLHRADLHDALRGALGDQHITLRARCVSVHQSNASVTVGFADGRTATGDLVIGADGVHSVVRSHVAGPDRATWARQVSWRGLAPAALGREIGLEMRHHSFWGPGKQFVAFYVSAGQRVNWVGNTQSDDEWQEESWSARGDRDELLGLYEGWHPEVRALIVGTEHVFKWALFDRSPIERWTRGRVTLLGDAAHPMLPYMAQGAGQSIEDGYVLAHCLTEGRENPVAGLHRYSDRRWERTAAVQEASRQAAYLVQLSNPAEVAVRNRSLAENPEAPIARFDWIWSYDVEQALTERVTTARSIRGAWNRTRSGRRPIEPCTQYAEASIGVVDAVLSDDSAVSREALLRLIDGYRLSQALHVAATLGIADLLEDGPRSVDDLAEATDTDPSALYRLLRALASVGVFAETDGAFSLTPPATYLRSGAPGSIRAWAIHIGQPYFWQSWGHLIDSVRTGEPVFPSLYGMSPWEYREAHPEANAIFNQAMTELATGVVDAVVESYDFSGMEMLVDVGGGEGALLAAILAAYPALRGILFDQPHVVTDARAVFERAGVAGRCEVAEGSFFDAVPAAAGAYLLKSIIHDWDDASAVRILRTCRAAIADTGKLLVVERVIRSGNDPDPAKYMDLNMLVMLGGRERTADDFRALYTQAGFHLTRIVPTPSGFSVIEGTPV